MKNELVTLTAKAPYGSIASGQGNSGVAPLEAVGRALGYTEKELVFAADVLNQFVWRRPAESSRKNAEATEAETIDHRLDRDHAA